MNKIIKFKKSKGNTYILYFDSTSITLYDDIITKYELIRKKEISDEELESIEKENHKLAAYYKALAYINIKVRSEKEVKEYLKKQGFLEQTISYTIQILKEKKYIDESRYIELYIEDSIRLKLDGPEKIKRNLVQLGLPNEKIENYLQEINPCIWEDKIRKIISKKNRTKHSESGVVWKRKIESYLYHNGYSKEMMEPMISDLQSQDDDSTLEREIQKWLKKYLQKYRKEEAYLRVKQKLIGKGYQKENIERILKKIEEQN